MINRTARALVASATAVALTAGMTVTPSATAEEVTNIELESQSLNGEGLENSEDEEVARIIILAAKGLISAAKKIPGALGKLRDAVHRGHSSFNQFCTNNIWCQSVTSGLTAIQLQELWEELKRQL